MIAKAKKTEPSYAQNSHQLKTFDALPLARPATPLLDAVYAILYQGKAPHHALRELLGREPRAEFD